MSAQTWSTARAAAAPALRAPAIMLAGLLVWLTVQDIALAFAFKFSPPVLIRGGLMLKESLLALTLVVLIFSRPRDHVRIGLFGVSVAYWLAIAALYAASGLADGLGLQGVVASLRSALFPAALLTAGRLLAPTAHEMRLLLTTLLVASLASVAFGVLERFVIGDRFWTSIVNLPGYLTDIKGVGAGLRPGVGLPWNFWWGDSVGLVRRMAGLSASPLALGYSLVLPTTLAIGAALFHAPRRLTLPWPAVALVFLLAAALSVTRMALVALAISVATIMVWRVMSRVQRRNGFAVAFIAVLAAVVLLAVLVTFSAGTVERIWNASWALSDGSSSRRLGFVANSWSNSSERLLVGAGFGSAGAWASTSATSESGYLALLHQVGVPGLLAFMLPWGVVTFHLARLSLRREDDGFRYARIAALATTVGLLPTGIFSEQIIAFTSSGAYWLLLGALSLPLASARVPAVPAHAVASARRAAYPPAAMTTARLASGPGALPADR